jgi:hypothetical protein
MINTVCLCGSTRFLDEFQVANTEFTKCGLSVITISMAMPKNVQDSQAEVGLKELLDLVHLNKILRADAVFVVGDGYIGRSTAREIIWAQMHGKPVITRTRGHTWEQEAHCVRSGSHSTHIYPKAESILLGKD